MNKASSGYRILPSWRRPDRATYAGKVDLWIPELAPSLSLMRGYRLGKISWEDLSFMYSCELQSPSAQDYLKPLALLSLRRKLVLLCDCADSLTCPNLVLVSALEECRNQGNFAMRPV